MNMNNAECYADSDTVEKKREKVCIFLVVYPILLKSVIYFDSMYYSISDIL
jgi:hypothetical protein